jgi:hypothetical protein
MIEQSMQRATSVLFLTLLAACTAPTAPTPAAESLVTRFFALHPCEREDMDAFSNPLEAHGIRCSSSGGFRNSSSSSCRTSCEGTPLQWRQAESDIARLTANGATDITPYPRYFEIIDASEVDKGSRTIAEALQVQDITCEFEPSSARSWAVCSGNGMEWRLAEPIIARLTADGVMQENPEDQPTRRAP